MGATTRKLRLRVSGNTPKPFSMGNKIGGAEYPLMRDTTCKRRLQVNGILPNPSQYNDKECR